MKALFKPTIVIATSILALSSYATSAAQSAEQPQIIKTAALSQTIATNPILRPAVKTAPKTTTQKTANATVSSASIGKIEQVTRLEIDDASAYIDYPTAEERRASRRNIEKYGSQFRGLRPSALTSNNGKIGSTTQYSRFNDNLHFGTQSTSNSRFKNDAENLFIRLQLDF